MTATPFSEEDRNRIDRNVQLLADLGPGDGHVPDVAQLTLGARVAIDKAQAKTAADVAAQNLRARHQPMKWFAGLWLVGPPLLAGSVIALSPSLRDFSRTGLAVTPAQSWWVAAWLLGSAAIVASIALRKGSGMASNLPNAQQAEAGARTAVAETAQPALVAASQAGLSNGSAGADGVASAAPTTAAENGAKAMEQALSAWQAARENLTDASAGDRRSGLRGMIVGGDGRVSTSLLQATAWTFALLYVFLDLLLLGWHVVNRPGTPHLAKYSAGFGKLVSQELRPEYFVLLGIPVSAAIFAKALYVSKSANNQIAKIPSGQYGVLTGVSEAIGNDQGQVDLLDLQYTAFNVIALIYFFAVFFGNTISHPEQGLTSIPPTLLALSGVSGAAYAAKKAVEQGTIPQINSVTPRLITIGRTSSPSIVVQGTDLCSSGQNAGNRHVSLAGVALAAHDWTAQQVTADLPLLPDTASSQGIQPGVADLVVTDDQGIDSLPFPVNIEFATDLDALSSLPKA